MNHELKPNYLLIGIFLLLAVFFATTIKTSADTYWHLAVGRQIVTERAIPTTDKFIYGPIDKTFNSVEWLFDIVLYSVENLLGMSGVTILRVLVGITSIYFFYLTISLISSSRETSSLITKNNIVNSFLVALTGYMLAFRLYDRPEIASFLFLAILNYSCLYYFFKKKLSFSSYLLPIIFLAWPNSHPFGIIGLAVFSFFIFIFLFETAVQKTKYQNLNQILAIYFISAALALVQFKKLFIFLELGSLNEHNLTEFYSLPQRLWLTRGFDIINQTSYDIYIYFIAALILIASLAALLKNWRKNLVLIFLGAFYLAIFLTPVKLYRILPSVFLIAAPAILLLAKNALPKIPAYTNKVIGACLAVMLLIIVISISQQRIAGIRDFAIVLYRGTEPANYKPEGVINLLWNPTFPQKEPEIIKKYINTKRFFTSTPWDEYFIWYLPHAQAFADALFYNRAQNDYNDQVALSNGQDNWQELLKKYDIDTVINSQQGSYWPVSVPVYTLPDWKLIYANDVAYVYARDDVIKNRPVDLSAINEGLHTALKFEDKDAELAVKQLQNLLAFDPQNAFAHSQLAMYYLKTDLEKSRSVSEEARKKYPKNPLFSLTLASYYLQKNQCQNATAFAKETIRKAFGDDSITTEAQDIKDNCQN